MDIQLLLIIALVLFSTKAMSLLTKKLHLPQVVGALMAGILLGPAVFNFIQPSETLSSMADIGVLLLLFSAGMETDFAKLRRSLGSSTVIAAMGIILAVGGGFGIAMLFGLSGIEAFFIGVIIASTSTSITVEALHELGKLKSTSGTAIMGTSVMDDILGIVILAVVLGMSTGGVSIASVGITLVRIIIFFIFATICGFGVNKLFNYMYGKFGIKRRFSIFALAFCFLMSFLAEQFGLASITGAFIAGIAFCNTRCVEQLETSTNTLSYMFFTPVFLANIGLHVNFAGLDGRIFLFTAFLVAVAMLAKIIGCGAGAKMCNYKNSESLQVGVGLMTRGEITLIVASKGIAHSLLDPGLFSSIILVVLVTVLLTPILLSVSYRSEGPALETEENEKE